MFILILISESHAINPMNVLLPEDYDEDICVICQESLSQCQTYKLPECNHEYHTHCIVTWFRHNNYTNNHQDGRCPCCGNAGINNNNNQRGKYWMKTKLNFILKEGKKTNAPKILTNLISKYYKKQEQINSCEENKKKFKKTLKNELVNYSCARQKIAQNQTNWWNARRSLNTIKDELISFPIVPIIIPTPIDINS